ncbi:MAG: hypothetical protein M1825_005954 [Sarcosagium campestre]|nr:MAG: hypothetical protein M1825_005954 [Sarcosagium campestre]
MKALRLHPPAPTADPNLKYDETQQRLEPLPQDSVLIRVHATSLTQGELSWPETTKDREYPIPGHDVSGIVVEVSASTSSSAPAAEHDDGKAPSALAIGDEVYGLIAFNRDGAAAEYTVGLRSELALKPRSLSHEQAAAVPLSALTAWQHIIDYGGLKAGQSVLVTGAAGGVGASAMQIAKAAGAGRVIGTGSSGSLDFIRGLGADLAVDYTKGNTLREAVAAAGATLGVDEKVDIVLDCVGGATLEGSFEVVKDGGAVCCVAEPARLEVRERFPKVRSRFWIVEPSGLQLETITQWIEEGKLRSIVDRVLPVEEGREAFRILARGHNRGKIVLKVRDS